MPKFPKGSQEAKDYMASIRAKRGKGVKKCSCEGKGDCSCCSGGSLVASAPPPPPPPPPGPPRPPPIDTSFSINQSLIDAIEEVLRSSSLPQERREQLMAELKRLKDKVNDAGVAKQSKAKPSGAGMKGKGGKSSKVEQETPKLTTSEFIRQNMEKNKKEAEIKRMEKEIKKQRKKIDEIQLEKNRDIAKAIVGKISPEDISSIKAKTKEMEDMFPSPLPPPESKAVIKKAQSKDAMSNFTDLLKAKKAMSGKGAGASMSLQTQLTRKMRERDVIVRVMASLQARMDDVMTAPEGGSFDERMRSLGAVSREMLSLVQRLSAVNTEINAIEDVLYPEDDGGDTESESSMEGTGGGAQSKLATPAIEELEAMVGDDMIGSIESVARATPVASAPEAMSYSVSEIPIRQQIKDLQKELRKVINTKKLTEQRISNTKRFPITEAFSARNLAIDEERLETLKEDIESLNSQIESLLSQITLDPNTAFIVSGSGMKKKKQKN